MNTYTTAKTHTTYLMLPGNQVAITQPLMMQRTQELGFPVVPVRSLPAQQLVAQGHLSAKVQG